MARCTAPVKATEQRAQRRLAPRVVVALVATILIRPTPHPTSCRETVGVALAHGPAAAGPAVAQDHVGRDQARP